MAFAKNLLVWLLLLAITSVGLAQKINKSFPQHVQYFKGCIKPNQASQKQLDAGVAAFYTQWKTRYIHTGCEAGQYYIWFENEPSGKQCVSEGQGYGMIIVALMAGYDKHAHDVYNGLYRYYKAHPSKRSIRLMAWAQNASCKDIDGTTATDGDMDIAYSLLLANAQWGSKGSINYLDEAKAMINAIMQQEINQKTFSVMLSNAVEYDSKDYYDMRSSDFMPANFKAFKNATHDARWAKVIDNNYALFKNLQNRYSPGAGLVPDFIQHTNCNPAPAHAHYLESAYDGFYNYNACRVPWRIAADYLLYGDKRSKQIADKINHWIRSTTGNNPDNISAGYTLHGDDMKGRYFEAMSFIAPFAVAAMIDAKNQLWLNKMWDYILKFNINAFDYYDNTIKMLNMLIITGNYWQPN